jgi:hypothetical protein
LGDNGKVGLGDKLLNKAKVCCCTLVWCGEVNVTVLLRLSNDGVKYMLLNDMIKCGQKTGNHSYGVKKKTHYSEGSELYVGLHHFDLNYFVERQDDDLSVKLLSGATPKFARSETDGNTAVYLEKLKHKKAAQALQNLPQENRLRTEAEATVAVQESEIARLTRELEECQQSMKMALQSPYTLENFVKDGSPPNEPLWEQRAMKSFTAFTLEQFLAIYDVVNYNGDFSRLNNNVTKTTFDRRKRNETAEKEAKLRSQNRLLMTMVVLKTGMPFKSCAGLFGVDETNVGRAFASTVLYLGVLFIRKCVLPDSKVCKRAEPACVKSAGGDYFLKYFLDTYCVQAQSPEDIHTRSALYSHYKHGWRFKVGTLVTTGGHLAGASEAFFGRATDDTVCRSMRILEDLLEGEAVEADRGFHEMIREFAAELKGFLTPATLKRGRPSKTDKDRRAGNQNYSPALRLEAGAVRRRGR